MNSDFVADELPFSDAELAIVTRSGSIESRHRGTLVVLSPAGKTVLALGNIHRPVYARSTLKPLQAIGVLKAGAPLRGEQVAIACASHRGTFEQMEAVQRLLAASGLNVSALQCPAVYPAHERSRTAMIEALLPKTALAHPCSGKHAAFLRACAAKIERGELDPESKLWDTENYLELTHPLQRIIAEEVEAFTGEPIAATGVDGCGAPIAALSLIGLARAYATLGSAIHNMEADARASTVATAMVDYPELIAAEDHPDTMVSEHLDAVVKSGAEGLLCIGLRSGASVAVKVSDGSCRPVHLIALRALEAAGYLSKKVADHLIHEVVPTVKGSVAGRHARAVGEILPGADLAAALEGTDKHPAGKKAVKKTGQKKNAGRHTGRTRTTATKPKRNAMTKGAKKGK